MASGTVASASSTTFDAKLGTSEHARFFGDGPLRMLGFLHSPPGEAIGGIVMCSPIGAEFLRNYRREVLLGRALAAAGVAVQRFHYRGSGNSDGETEDLTFDTMLEDSLSAAAWLDEQTGISRPAFLGTRLGACVASAAARSFPGTPLILWEPAIDCRRYLEEVFRAGLVRGLQDAGTEELDDDQTRLHRDGLIDVLGYPISLGFYRSTVVRNLATELNGDPRPLLVAQIGPRTRLRRDYERFVAERQAEGWDAEAMNFVLPHEAWWFATPDEGEQPGARTALRRSVVEETSGWLLQRLAPEAVR